VPLPFRLLILTPGFPVDESDTSCIPALQDFVLGWKSGFPEVTLKVISFEYPHQTKKYVWNQIDVYCAGGKSRKGIFKLITWWKVFVQLFLTKEKKQTVIISYFLTEATYIGQIFSKIFRIRHISIAAGQDVRKTNRYLNRIDFGKLKVVALNQKMADELFRSCGRKADCVIPMGAGEMGNLRSTSSENRSIDVLIVGSLIPLKQTDKAIQIIADLKKEFPKIVVEIIGGGPERKKLENLVMQYQLTTNISFCGALKRELVFQKMQEAKILLHTSEFEGQATVITEALAFGMTVVCFDVGRISDHAHRPDGQEKIHVCGDEKEMMPVLKNLLHENNFDFAPVIPFTMTETVNEYQKIVQSIS